MKFTDKSTIGCFAWPNPAQKRVMDGDRNSNESGGGAGLRPARL